MTSSWCHHMLASSSSEKPPLLLMLFLINTCPQITIMSDDYSKGLLPPLSTFISMLISLKHSLYISNIVTFGTYNIYIHMQFLFCIYTHAHIGSGPTARSQLGSALARSRLSWGYMDGWMAYVIYTYLLMLSSGKSFKPNQSPNCLLLMTIIGVSRDRWLGWTLALIRFAYKTDLSTKHSKLI